MASTGKLLMETRIDEGPFRYVDLEAAQASRIEDVFINSVDRTGRDGTVCGERLELVQ